MTAILTGDIQTTIDHRARRAHAWLTGYSDAIAGTPGGGILRATSPEDYDRGYRAGAASRADSFKLEQAEAERFHDRGNLIAAAGRP